MPRVATAAGSGSNGRSYLRVTTQLDFTAADPMNARMSYRHATAPEYELAIDGSTADHLTAGVARVLGPAQPGAILLKHRLDDLHPGRDDDVPSCRPRWLPVSRYWYAELDARTGKLLRLADLAALRDGEQIYLGHRLLRKAAAGAG